MMKVVITYPNRNEERAILDAMATTEPLVAVRHVLSQEQLLAARHVVNAIHIDDKIRNYIVDLVLATRAPIASSLDLNGYIQNGASPRATINLCLAARGMAFLNGRHYVTPHDVKSIALDVLRHRITVSYEAEAEKRHGRGRRPQDPRHAAGALGERHAAHHTDDSHEDHPSDYSSSRHPHTSADERWAGRRLSLRVQGTRHGFRRSTGIRAGGRDTHHRLERHRACRAPVRQEIHRRA